MVLIFKESYKKFYYSSWISFPSCITVTVGIVLILLPFFTAFSGKNVFYEHPVIRYNNQYMLYMNYDDGTPKNHSSFPALNTGENLAQVMIVDVLKNDTNNDDIIDSIQFRILISETAANIRNIKLMLFFDYIIQTKAKMQTQTMCYMNVDTPYGASQVIANGDLVLHQKRPMMVVPYLIKPDDYFKTITGNYFDQIYTEFTSTRNFTTQFDYKASVKPYYSTDTVEIILNIVIPTNQKIIYEMSTAESLKFNWIQYLALFIPLIFIVKSLLSFIFENRLFHCSVVTDLPKIIN